MTPSPVDADLDANAAAGLQRAHFGGHTLKHVLPQQYPTLGPDHSDVDVAEDEVNFGVSAGDETHPTPYAFWNAPFGALYPLVAGHDIDALTAEIADFFKRGRTELGIRP